MDEFLKKDVKMATKMIREGYCNQDAFTKYSYLYPCTTENITGYYNQIDFRDKVVLTVAASGDHAFNALLCGAKEVDTFDINRLTYYYINLKKKIIENYAYKTFWNFFLSRNHSSFNEHLYEKIKGNLNARTQEFWDSIYRKFEGLVIREGLFRYVDHDLIVNKKIIDNSPYLCRESYNELQKVINNSDIGFIESNIVNLGARIDNNKYDLILLSNISNYIDQLYSHDQLQQYKDLIMNLSSKLKPNGSIVFAYIYGDSESYYGACRDHFNEAEKRNAVFKPNTFETITFQNYINPQASDAVMIYKKH